MDTDFDFDIFEGYDPEKEKWDALIEAAIEGKVVPVIGPDIICDFPDGSNINEYIINQIKKNLKLSDTYKTFSELIYDPEFVAKLTALQKAKGLLNTPSAKEAIYGIINNLVVNSPKAKETFKPSKILKKLLSIKLFPFVITTSFAPVVENAMKEVWGYRKVKTLSFCKNSLKDKEPGIGDIRSMSDMENPTIYYMFGRAGHGSYVLTDNDMLNFCQAWLSEGKRPENLCSQLQNKYLLMLGCGYSDWLFRFIWFCMKNNPDEKNIVLMAPGRALNESLVEYLRRIDTFLPSKKSPEEIISEIDSRISAYHDSHSDKWFGRPPKIRTQVFISYSRRDDDIAARLFEYLQKQGLKVWYDKNDLLGGMKFEDKILDAIENAQLFIPILTPTITKEAGDPHVYRKEWNKAIDLLSQMGPREYIIPFHDEQFDMYGKEINSKFKELHAISFNANDPEKGFSALLDSIYSALNKLDSSSFNTIK